MSSLSEEEIRQLNKQAEIEAAKRLATVRLLIGAINSSPKDDYQWADFRQKNVPPGSMEETVFTGVKGLMEGIKDNPDAHTALLRSLNLVEEGIQVNNLFRIVSQTEEGRLLVGKFLQVARGQAPLSGR